MPPLIAYSARTAPVEGVTTRYRSRVLIAAQAAARELEVAHLGPRRGVGGAVDLAEELDLVDGAVVARDELDVVVLVGTDVDAALLGRGDEVRQRTDEPRRGGVRLRAVEARRGARSSACSRRCSCRPSALTTSRPDVVWRSSLEAMYWSPASFGWTLVKPVPSPSLSTIVPACACANSRTMPVATGAVLKDQLVAAIGLPARSRIAAGQGRRVERCRRRGWPPDPASRCGSGRRRSTVPVTGGAAPAASVKAVPVIDRRVHRLGERGRDRHVRGDAGRVGDRGARRDRGRGGIDGDRDDRRRWARRCRPRRSLSAV